MRLAQRTLKYRNRPKYLHSRTRCISTSSSQLQKTDDAAYVNVGHFIELSNLPRFFSEADVLRLLTKESSKIQADDIRMVTQRVEPSPASKLHPERRWIVGFSEANTASNFAEKLNNQSAGLSQVKCRLLGEVKFTDNYMVNPMIKAKYVPRGINSHSLREWVSPVVNLAFTTSTLDPQGVTFETNGEVERSLILMTRHLTRFNGNLVELEAVDGH